MGTKSRTLCRGVCPKCGRRGTIIIKVIHGKEYVYFRHGRQWCYVGPARRIPIEKLIELAASEVRRA